MDGKSVLRAPEETFCTQSRYTGNKDGRLPFEPKQPLTMRKGGLGVVSELSWEMKPEVRKRGRQCLLCP